MTIPLHRKETVKGWHIALTVVIVMIAIVLLNPFGIMEILDPGAPPTAAFNGWVPETTPTGVAFVWRVITPPDAWFRHVTEIYVPNHGVIRTYHYVWKVKESQMMMTAVDSLTTAGELPQGFSKF